MIDVTSPATFLPMAVLLLTHNPAATPRWRRGVYLVAIIAFGGICLARWFLGFRIMAPISTQFGISLEVLTSLTMLLTGLAVMIRSQRARDARNLAKGA